MVKPRLGHIHFLNVLPITYSLNNLNYKEGLELSNGVPAVINNDLLNNRVDVSEVSSIVYARNYDKLLMLPDLCVRADGEVRSIILVSKKPIEEINEDKIILTAQSATSHCLLKIIMAKAYDANPQYFIRNLTPDNPVPNDATAALFIGDDALNVNLHQEPYKSYYYDLGREWKKLTAVYMPWIDLDGSPFYGEGRAWQRQTHIYGRPFYYIDYCLAQTVALEFWVIMQKDRNDAFERYMKLVRLGGEESFDSISAIFRLISSAVFEFE